MNQAVTAQSTVVRMRRNKLKAVKQKSLPATMLRRSKLYSIRRTLAGITSESLGVPPVRMRKHETSPSNSDISLVVDRLISLCFTLVIFINLPVFSSTFIDALT